MLEIPPTVYETSTSVFHVFVDNKDAFDDSGVLGSYKKNLGNLIMFVGMNHLMIKLKFDRGIIRGVM